MTDHQDQPESALDYPKHAARAAREKIQRDALSAQIKVVQEAISRQRESMAQTLLGINGVANKQAAIAPQHAAALEESRRAVAKAISESVARLSQYSSDIRRGAATAAAALALAGISSRRDYSALVEAMRGAIARAAESIEQTRREQAATIYSRTEVVLPKPIVRSEDEVLPASFVDDVAEVVEDAVVTGISGEAFTNRLEQLIEKKISSLPQGKPAWKDISTIIAVLAFIVPLIVQVLNNREARRDRQEDLTKQAQYQEQEIAELRQINQSLGLLLAERNRSVFYRVERRVQLHQRPQNKAQVIGALEPGDEVRLVERRHAWIYVEYYDDSDNLPKFAWAMKKYMSINR